MKRLLWLIQTTLKLYIKKIIYKSYEWLEYIPHLKVLLIQVINRFPRIKNRLKRALQRSYMPSIPDLETTPYEEAILHRLTFKIEIEEQRHKRYETTD